MPDWALCVGGPDDGRWREIRPGQRTIRVLGRLPMPLPSWPEQVPSATVEVPVTIYTVRLFRAPDRAFLLLAPHGVSDSDAIDQLFRGYGVPRAIGLGVEDA